MTPDPKRHWFRFSLSSLFWLTIVAGLIAFAVRQQEEIRSVEGERDFWKVEAASATKSAAKHEALWLRSQESGRWMWERREAAAKAEAAKRP